MILMHRLAIFGTLAIVLVAGPAFADGDYAKAKRAYDAGAIDLAMRYLPGLARGGDARAQFLLGYIYEYGKFEEESQAKARYWYERSALQDHTPGVGHLGYLMLKHPKNPHERLRALKLLETASKRGHVFSQREFGIAIHKTERSQAIYWLRRAVDKKDSDAALVLSALYDMSKERSSFHESYYWTIIHLRLVDVNGYDIDRSKIHSNKMTYREAAEVERRAAAWLTARGVAP